MGLYNDLIAITPITLDSYHNVTTGTVHTHNGRFYNKGKEQYSGNGKTLDYQYVILIPDNISVKEGDLISITKFKGETISEYQNMEVKAVLKTGTFGIHHTEIYA